ncbi:hypothetical protein BD770DRAFT_476787 [Pilaira anomala]|nr:hypothetical protein BD770DRAFT_476787 [Pilaira anomala]
MDFTDKIVIIYGGTSGIGKELVFLFISKGAYVLFTGTKQEKADLVLDQLNQDFPDSAHRAVFFCADITDWKAQEKVYTLAEENFGNLIDIVILVAGIMDSSNLIQDTEQDNHYRTLEVNITATAKANRLAVQYFLKAKKPGCVINTSSVYGLTGSCTFPLYAASKHAIIGLTKSYGNLLRSTDIRINVIAPHFVETPLLSGEQLKTATNIGFVTMENCLDAYLYAIKETSLNGDVINVSPKGRKVEPRFSDPIIEQLDYMCNQRRIDTLNALLEHFQ